MVGRRYRHRPRSVVPGPWSSRRSQGAVVLAVDNCGPVSKPTARRTDRADGEQHSRWQREFGDCQDGLEGRIDLIRML